MTKFLNMRIVFMGTPDFAVATLERLIENGFNVRTVVTVPDKPAGRGQKLQSSPVKLCALKNNIPIVQPDKLKDPQFIQELHYIAADIFIVVAFRMLPELVWKIPKSGTINLHASLLPQYRGAAPINWALINGEKVTGVTTFFIEKDIDTGEIIMQEKMSISDEDTAGDLHDRLMTTGADLIIKTLKTIESGKYQKIKQQEIEAPQDKLKPAPKIFREDCKIDWNKDVESIYNIIRGLSPYPTAFTELSDNSGNKMQLKIYATKKNVSAHSHKAGSIFTDGKNEIKIAVNDGYIIVDLLQLEGRKRLTASEFLRGFPALSDYHCI
jgi:methionyl-tRNA formyltransferase